MTKFQYYLKGAKAGIPVLLGFIPVGIAYAIMARSSGLSVLETGFMSMSVFAGASQMMAVGMYGQGAAIFALIIATFIINLRHLIMSTCVVNKIKTEKLSLKLLASFGVTDESFAIFTTATESSIWYFLGIITVTYSAWVGSSFLGAVFADFLPEIVSKSFAVALYALFIGLLVPSLKNNGRLCLLIVITALCNSVLSLYIPSSWALVASTLLCAFLGVFFVDLEENGNEN